MNDKAKELNLKNTSFANPIGLDDKNNYSTVDEVAIILKKCLENEQLNKIITSKEYTLSDGTKIKHTIDWYAKKLETDLSFIKGAKTGFETNSGYALASIAEKDGVTLLLVTTNGKEKYNHIEDAKTIYNYYFDNYSYQTLIKKGYPVVTLKGKYLNKKKIDIYESEDVKAYVEKDFDKNDVKIIYEGIETLTVKNKKGSNLGKLKIYYKDDLIKEENIILNKTLYPDFKLIAVACFAYLTIITTTVTVIKRIRKKAY